MSTARPSLPAYIRLPGGLRIAGTVSLAEDQVLCFAAKQTIGRLPPEGLPVHLTVTGVPGNEGAQFNVAGNIESSSAREARITADAPVPDQLRKALAQNAIAHTPAKQDSAQLLTAMRRMGSEQLSKAMQDFLTELGEELFEISTSSRHAVAGRHEHYEALNTLKRQKSRCLDQFTQLLAQSMDSLEKEDKTQTFANLDRASAQNLNLVALDEMDQKLAIDKTVGVIFEAHRVELECLTIRAALVGKLEPREARTPFHPAYVVQAFVKAFSEVSESPVVAKDALVFFGKNYSPSLTSIYTSLNALFINAGVEPNLEDDIRKHGSLLGPVDKRSVTSLPRATPDDNGEAPPTAADAQLENRRAGDASSSAVSETRGDRHDAMYDAVLNALDTRRASAGRLRPPGSPGFANDREIPLNCGAASPSHPGGHHPPGGSDAAVDNGSNALRGYDDPAGPTVSHEQLLETLRSMQGSEAVSESLGDLQPLESLVAQQHEGSAELDRDGANRLGFVDNVFRTLHDNFEVSEGMAPSLAKLRVPLARLSLREPRFFTQPEHPAHKLLDKLSVLACAEHTANHALKNKVQGIIDRVVENYEDDSSAFESAQADLDQLLQQQGRSQSRNVERVIGGLEGQERLSSAQRRVENLLDECLDREAAPDPLLQLLDSGWKASLVQLALRESEDSVAWTEEAALLQTLLQDMQSSTNGELPDTQLKELQQRLHALNNRLHSSNPGSLAHEDALRKVNAVLTGESPLATAPYPAATTPFVRPDAQRVEQLPRLRRWLRRVTELEPGAKLRYRDKAGRRRLMRLVWVSENKDRFAFVNERGQKIAELTAIQLARQLSRGARPPTTVDRMSVLDQSVYETLERAQKTLSFDRNTDSLTQLINGDSLLFQLRRSLRHAQARGSEHAFMLLNIDNFALVNEVFDETSGDQVLTEFARLLGQLNDRRALTARIAGDQFGILLTYSSTEDGRKTGEKIRRDISHSSLEVGGESVSFTVSIGVAAVAQASESDERVVAQAQAALDMAKTQGRDQVVVYDIDQQEVLEYKRERAASRRRLDEAMSTDSLVLRAQPIVKTAVGAESLASQHYEILLALRNEDGELGSPREFLRSAERFGYVTLVDRWVLRETFSWISRLMDAQKEVPEVSINLSGTSITDNDFLDYVLGEISEHGVGTSRLCFEITETGAIDNLPKAADFVSTLKNIGCKFSLADFGTGPASHKYLRELPVDYVKIDGTFISNVHKNSTDFAMAKSINDLAHFLGQETIAECVDNLDLVPSLKEIGVDYLQGGGIGVPKELQEVTELLRNLQT